MSTDMISHEQCAGRIIPSDTLDRAYQAGLITETDRNIGSALAEQYWSVWTHEQSDDGHTLVDSLTHVRSKGRPVYRAFSQLVIDIHIEHGPQWLDRMIEGRPIPTDPETLDMAILGLRQISTEELS